MTNNIQKLSFYITPLHDCSYFDDRQAITLFADPKFPKNQKLYSSLAKHGFRRSGNHLYQPHCETCMACIPVRIPVNHFSPRRSQRRNWRMNKNLTVKAVSAEYRDEHFELYQRYLSERHPDGGMDNPSPKNYKEFLISDWIETVFYEIRQSGSLLAVAVADKLEDGLSAVYTFFDPDYLRQGLGTYAILFEIEETKRLGYKWLYMGYWIEHCGKMNYKNDFQPLEYYLNGSWQRLPGKK